MVPMELAIVLMVIQMLGLLNVENATELASLVSLPLQLALHVIHSSLELLLEILVLALTAMLILDFFLVYVQNAIIHA